MRIGVVQGLLLAAIPLAAYGQPPAITQEGVRNAASQIPPSLPGGAIAPGARITIRGLRLGGEKSVVRVQIRQNDSDLEAAVISADPERVEALMPLEAQPGDAQLVVTRDGQPSRPFPLRIVPAAFGIFARNGKGWGQGEMLNTPSAPAHPGETVTIVGTGLGRPRAVEVFVGGRRASRVLSRVPPRGRAGWEEIRFQLARDTSLGCYVPVVVKIGNNVSNAVTMSLAPMGRRCSEIARPDALILLARLMLHVRLTEGAPVDFIEDVGAAIFPAGDDLENLRRTWQRLPPTGTCTAYTGRWPVLPSMTAPGRDAGPRIWVAGPKGTSPLEPQPQLHGVYSAVLGGGFSLLHANKPPFLESGEYRISGPGGKGIGAFTAEARSSPALEWLHPERWDTIDRARGAAVEWQGATAHQQVILAAVNADPLSGAAAMCLCAAPGEAGHWQLPPLFLANLPASQSVPGIPLNYLLMAALPAEPQRFRSGGVENGMVVVTTVRGRTVRYR